MDGTKRSHFPTDGIVLALACVANKYDILSLTRTRPLVTFIL